MSRFAVFNDMKDKSEHIVDLEGHCEVDLEIITNFLNGLTEHETDVRDFINGFEELKIYE